MKLASRLLTPRTAAPPAPAATWTIWITGLPGSGKTTLAWSAAETLVARGVRVRVVDAAEMRLTLLGGRQATAAEEDVLHRTVVYAAKLLTEAGVPVLVDATAPRRSWREMARAAIARFAEVQLVCPREICGERERAVRWQLAPCGHAARAEITTRGPDIVLDYEEALHPELILHTDVQHPATAAEAIVMLAWRLEVAAGAEAWTRERRIS